MKGKRKKNQKKTGEREEIYMIQRFIVVDAVTSALAKIYV